MVMFNTAHSRSSSALRVARALGLAALTAMSGTAGAQEAGHYHPERAEKAPNGKWVVGGNNKTLKRDVTGGDGERHHKGEGVPNNPALVGKRQYFNDRNNAEEAAKANREARMRCQLGRAFGCPSR